MVVTYRVPPLLARSSLHEIQEAPWPQKRPEHGQPGRHRTHTLALNSLVRHDEMQAHLPRPQAQGTDAGPVQSLCACSLARPPHQTRPRPPSLSRERPQACQATTTQKTATSALAKHPQPRPAPTNSPPQRPPATSCCSTGPTRGDRPAAASCTGGRQSVVSRAAGRAPVGRQRVLGSLVARTVRQVYLCPTHHNGAGRQDQSFNPFLHPLPSVPARRCRGRLTSRSCSSFCRLHRLCQPRAHSSPACSSSSMGRRPVARQRQHPPPAPTRPATLTPWLVCTACP